MRLVACPNCHIQYDVSQVEEAQLRCPCGTEVRLTTPTPVDARVHRCGSCGAAVGGEAASCDYCHSEIIRDTQNFSLICPECFARNAEETKFCTSCGVEFNPQAPPVGADTLDCPVCARAMQLRAIGGIPIQECGQCNGIWIPENQFDTLVNKAVDAQRENPSEGLVVAASDKPVTYTGKIEYRKCPACDGPMSRRNFGKRSGVIVDFCPADGTWLDADELHHIAKFIIQGGLKRKDERYDTDLVAWGGGGGAKLKQQMEAMVWAEKTMAAEKAKQEARRHAMQRLDGNRNRENSIGNLLEDLLGL